MSIVTARPWGLVPRLALAWLGIWVHELHRVPASFGLTPEGSLPFLGVPLLGWLALARLGQRRPLLVFLLCYGLIGLASAVVTVLPLRWLPFFPEQTVRHYAVHLAWAVLQLPLLVMAWRSLRRDSEGPVEGVAAPLR